MCQGRLWSIWKYFLWYVTALKTKQYSVVFLAGVKNQGPERFASHDWRIRGN